MTARDSIALGVWCTEGQGAWHPDRTTYRQGQLWSRKIGRANCGVEKSASRDRGRKRRRHPNGGKVAREPNRNPGTSQEEPHCRASLVAFVVRSQRVAALDGAPVFICLVLLCAQSATHDFWESTVVLLVPPPTTGSADGVWACLGVYFYSVVAPRDSQSVSYDGVGQGGSLRPHYHTMSQLQGPHGAGSA